MNTFILLAVTILCFKRLTTQFARLLLRVHYATDAVITVIGLATLAALAIGFLWLIIKSMIANPHEALITLVLSFTTSLFLGGIELLTKWAKNHTKDTSHQV